ncbi:MAG: hydroxymethylglutaryl-CoA reductase [Anaerolineae bacterium]|nr:hydroxymethylglutaryl-CoA reductase [Anaerolineae bacterium]
MHIPNLILKQLYTVGSLKNTHAGVQFSVKNRLRETQITHLLSIKLDDLLVPLDAITLDLGDGVRLHPANISDASPLFFPLRKVVTINLDIAPLELGKHDLEFSFSAVPFGQIKVTVNDVINADIVPLTGLPRDEADDYAASVISERQSFVEEFSGVPVQHVKRYSFDPHLARGNCEHFTGVVQIPLGFAGPMKINGEHAHGEFLIPLATSEGTLVASYNRGIKLLNLCGGAKCTVVADAMQRAPVFVFEDARGGREFINWVKLHLDDIRAEAEATSNVAKLLYIDPYLSNKFAFLRFNYSTGDAAGQNMVGRATFAACSWIIEQYKDHAIQHFYLESNFATDKKGSQVNMLHTRGKRVTAEITIKRETLIKTMRVEPESLYRHASFANVGAFLSGANNNGCHSTNAITALFIATGQDVANVAESSAAILYTELTPEDDLYVSLTIPSLIVATYGGGTGLPTQRECLEVMGCYGKGHVNKLAEIVAGVALAGELSLGAAISSLDWVSSHEKYGRNR